MFDEIEMAEAGEHAIELQGEIGKIEALLSVPKHQNSNFIAVLGHPHSLQGGTMNNKVVTTMARTFRDLGIVSLRMNFRGVGNSGGEFDAGIGESEDMLGVIDALMAKVPQANLVLSGFSFGSYVTYRAACQRDCQLLVSIAPPVHHYDYKAFAQRPKNWLVVQGLSDEVVPAEEVLTFFSPMTGTDILEFDETGHFFHGKLIELKQALTEAITKTLNLE